MVMAMMTCHAAVFGVRALQQFNQFIDSYLQFSITLHAAHQAAHCAKMPHVQPCGNPFAPSNSATNSTSKAASPIQLDSKQKRRMPSNKARGHDHAKSRVMPPATSWARHFESSAMRQKNPGVRGNATPGGRSSTSFSAEKMTPRMVREERGQSPMASDNFRRRHHQAPKLR